MAVAVDRNRPATSAIAPSGQNCFATESTRSHPQDRVFHGFLARRPGKGVLIQHPCLTGRGADCAHRWGRRLTDSSQTGQER